MQDKESIKKLYVDKIKKLNKHNRLYYSKDKPVITDKEYDDIKKSVLELENKYNFLSDKNSPSKNIGFTPSKVF